MAGKSQIQMKMRREHQSEAVAHLVMDGWTVDQVHRWSTDLGYTFSRSAWGRFAKEHVGRFEDSETLRLQSQIISNEFGGAAALEMSDMIGHYLNKVTIKVLETVRADDEGAFEKVHKMAQAYSTVARAGVQVEKLRQTWSKAKLEAYSEVEAEFRAGFAASYPEAWEKFQQWLSERASAERATAEAA